MTVLFPDATASGQSDGITCIECGASFIRSQGYQGNYCEDCRNHVRNLETTDD